MCGYSLTSSPKPTGDVASDNNMLDTIEMEKGTKTAFCYLVPELSCFLFPVPLVTDLNAADNLKTVNVLSNICIQEANDAAKEEHTLTNSQKIENIGSNNMLDVIQKGTSNCYLLFSTWTKLLYFSLNVNIILLALKLVSTKHLF